MALPSIGRILVDAQKRVTAGHLALQGTPVGRMVNAVTPGRGVLVLHTTGRRTGAARRTVLSYFDDGDDHVVIASDGGAARPPDWYANLKAEPLVEVEIDGERRPVRAETVDGPDRFRLWRRAVRTYPGCGVYQLRADREIPVVRLTRR